MPEIMGVSKLRWTSGHPVCNLPPKMKDKSDPAVKMLHKLGFGDGDEEPSEVA